MSKDKIDSLETTVDAGGINGIQKLLKLSTTTTTTNMHLFNTDCKLCKYATVKDIIEDFCVVRMKTYQDRKNYMINNLERLLKKLSNRARFIQMNLDGTIDLRRRKTLKLLKCLLK
jgi:DNA topoisomerase-2